MGGVSGNAGLFSTAQELGKIYQMILNEGELDGKRYLRPETAVYLLRRNQLSVIVDWGMTNLI